MKKEQAELVAEALTLALRQWLAQAPEVLEFVNREFPSEVPWRPEDLVVRPRRTPLRGQVSFTGDPPSPLSSIDEPF